MSKKTGAAVAERADGGRHTRLAMFRGDTTSRAGASYRQGAVSGRSLAARRRRFQSTTGKTGHRLLRAWRARLAAASHVSLPPNQYITCAATAITKSLTLGAQRLVLH